MAMGNLTITALCIFGTVFSYFVYSTSKWAASKRLPPGPPLKLFGASGRKAGSNLPPWKLFTALQKQFGPVSSFYQGFTPVIVLGTMKTANDLLNKRGNIYSSRPRNIMAGELLSKGMRGLGMPYGTRWRNWRALMHAGMGIEASQNYKSLQSLESRILLRDLLLEKDPTKYASHLRRFAISIVLCVGYGQRISSLNDPVVISNQKTDECFIRMSTPGQYIVESYPILLKLPRFLQWFRPEPEAQYARDSELYVSLINDVRRQTELGLAQPSIARTALEKQADFGLNDIETAFAVSAPFGAGVGTTLATLDVFFLAMLHYPEVMKKAQAEIDSLVASNRRPEFEDADALPYVRAMIKETMRWRPIAPMGIPHSVISDDVYEGMYIPKGSTVIGNIYSMSQDETMFPCPDTFRPERYLNVEQATSAPNSTFFFGFGRRICPGMHIALNSLFIVITRILWAFDINPPKDSDGKPVIPSTDDFIGGLVIRPRPFTFSLEFRRPEEGAKQVIEMESKQAEDEVMAWK